MTRSFVMLSVVSGALSFASFGCSFASKGPTVAVDVVQVGPADASPSTDGASASPSPLTPAGDAAVPPVPVDAGGEDADCGGATICEDFESFALGTLPDAGPVWSIEAPSCSGTGTMLIDEAEAHSGTRSLKVVGAAGYCNHVFLGTRLAAPLSSEVWGRFYVRFSTPLTADHATFLAMHDATANQDLRMGGQDSVLMWNRESDDATLPAMSPQGTALSLVVSPNEWHCIEFAVRSSPAAIRTWVDRSLVSGLVAGDGGVVAADSQWMSNTAWSPSLTDVRFGWESYASESETLWFDDLAIGESRIGCVAP